MHEIDCPPFLEVLFYLLSIILSFAMIGWLLLWLSLWKPFIVPVGVLIGFIAFGVMIVYSFFRLIQGLFPERKRGCRVCSLLREVMEIDLPGM